jgi:hypothetical protein
VLHQSREEIDLRVLLLYQPMAEDVRQCERTQGSNRVDEQRVRTVE